MSINSTGDKDSNEIKVNPDRSINTGARIPTAVKSAIIPITNYSYISLILDKEIQHKETTMLLYKDDRTENFFRKLEIQPFKKS